MYETILGFVYGLSFVYESDFRWRRTQATIQRPQAGVIGGGRRRKERTSGRVVCKQQQR